MESKAQSQLAPAGHGQILHVKNFETGRTLVLGTGYVASAFLRALHFLGLRPQVFSRDWVDYEDPGELQTCIEAGKFQLVINAAGYTGRTVDDCETNKQQCYASNVTLPRNIAQVCKATGATMLHVSSGCIFQGVGPFTEQDTPNNLAVFYAQCKIHAEREIADTGARAYLFRIRMPFNWQLNPRNWLFKLKNYPKILDGLNSITFLDEFAIRSYHLCQKAEPGIYHATSSVPVRTAFVARMLLDAGIRQDPVELYRPETFLLDGHVPRSEAVLDVRKFEAAYGAPFGDPILALRWAIENFGVAKLNAAVAASAP